MRSYLIQVCASAGLGLALTLVGWVPLDKRCRRDTRRPCGGEDDSRVC